MLYLSLKRVWRLALDFVRTMPKSVLALRHDERGGLSLVLPKDMMPLMVISRRRNMALCTKYHDWLNICWPEHRLTFSYLGTRKVASDPNCDHITGCHC